MKVFDAALATHLALGCTTLATALKITRRDGEVFAFTSHDQDTDEIGDGETYLARPGLDASQLVVSSGFNVGNMELRTLHDGTLFTLADLLQRRWENADYTIFQYNWASPSDGINTLSTGTLGDLSMREGMVVAQLRDLRQYLRHEVGNVSSKLCRYELGDTKCGFELGGSPSVYTVTGTVTGVTSARVFTDSGRAEGSDYFGNGLLTWNSGDNDGLTFRIESFASSVFTLIEPMVLDIQVGDDYTAIVGCRKRKDTDCRDKFDNVINFGGEWHRPTIDNVTAGITVSV